MISKGTVTGNIPVLFIGLYFDDDLGATVFFKMKPITRGFSDEGGS
jgi:hypothetical protein